MRAPLPNTPRIRPRDAAPLPHPMAENTAAGGIARQGDTPTPIQETPR